MAIAGSKAKSPKIASSSGFYFRLNPLMSGEHGCEITSDVSVIHYCYGKRVRSAGHRREEVRQYCQSDLGAWTGWR